MLDKLPELYEGPAGKVTKAKGIVTQPRTLRYAAAHGYPEGGAAKLVQLMVHQLVQYDISVICSSGIDESKWDASFHNRFAVEPASRRKREGEGERET